MRLNKFISLCGVASRRGADELIKALKVSVNGKVVEDLASSSARQQPAGAAAAQTADMST